MMFFLKESYLMAFKSIAACFSLDCINGLCITSQSGFVGGQDPVNALEREVKKRNSRVIDNFMIGIIVVPS